MLTDILPGLGIALQKRTCRVTCKKSGGISQGEVGEFLFLAPNGENNNIGDVDSKFATIGAPSATVGGSYAPVDYLIFCIALEDIAENQQGEVQIQGVVEAEVATQVTVRGEPLTVSEISGTLTGAPTITAKTVGVALELTSGTGEKGQVLFDGLYGFGAGS